MYVARIVKSAINEGNSKYTLCCSATSDLRFIGWLAFVSGHGKLYFGTRSKNVTSHSMLRSERYCLLSPLSNIPSQGHENNINKGCNPHFLENFGVISNHGIHKTTFLEWRLSLNHALTT